MVSIKDEIAKSLQFYRKQKNMTQRELAEKIGVRHNSISSWENGVNSIDIDTLFQICEVLDVKISDMYGGFGSAGCDADYSSLEHQIIKNYRTAIPAVKDACLRLLEIDPSEFSSSDNEKRHA